MNIDKQLFKQLKKHNKKAQLQFYKQCFNVMMGTAFRYKSNRDDAAILVNEAFLKVLTNLDKYDQSKPLESWLIRIVINVAIDDYRKSNKFNDFFKKDPSDIESQAYSFSHVDEVFGNETVKEILKQLPKATNLVFNLYALDGYSYKEISEMLSISIDTSKWHVKDARKRLKSIIGNSSLHAGFLLIIFLNL